MPTCFNINTLSAATILSVCFSVASAVSPASADPFVLKDGDRVVFLGNSFFERAMDHGYIETLLALQWPDRTITFRNLGWDGDTVFGHSRAGGRRRAVFGDVDEGFDRMVSHVKSLKPTVVFLAYGYNESFRDLNGVIPFEKGLIRLISNLDSGGVRFVLLSPTPMEPGFGTELSGLRDAGSSEPTYIEQRNATLQRYSDAIRRVSATGGHIFVDLFNSLAKQPHPFSDDGIHPSEQGYQRIAGLLAHQLNLPNSNVDLIVSKQAEELRRAIIKKNTLYYHRWRPRNDAFVYGERKDEQRIAQTEPAQFEPFISKQERLIRDLISASTAR